MKKLLCGMLVVALVLTFLSACGETENPTNQTTTTQADTTTTTQAESTTLFSLHDTHPKYIWSSAQRPDVEHNKDEAIWLTFSETDYETERKAIKQWLSDELDVIKNSMGESYYEPRIYIAKYDMDNDGVEDFITVLSHIAYTGSAGDSLCIMFYDGEKIVAEENICHCRVDLDALKNEGNKQIGIFPYSKYNDMYVLGNMWICGIRYGE